MNDIKGQNHPLAILIRLGYIAGSIRDLDYLIPQEIERLASERPEFLRVSRLRALSHIAEREGAVEDLCQIMREMGMLASLDGLPEKFSVMSRQFAIFKADLEQALGYDRKERLVTSS